MDDLRSRLNTRSGHPVVELDLAAVTFIDSTVISVRVIAHHAAKTAGGRLVLINCTGQVRRVLKTQASCRCSAPTTPPARRRRATSDQVPRCPAMFRLAKPGWRC
ncbi:STAS domain-containing protein [Micromonospora aurantiaca]|nr:STAS domain-containing protein [Micromonospora aurantiaca]